jgi:hypothetical protein
MKRMKILHILLIAVVFAAPAGLRAAIVDENNAFPLVVSPGQEVKVKGAFELAKPTAAAKLYPVGSTDPKGIKEAKDARVTADKEVTITLPNDLAPGRYYVKLTYNAATEQVPGELRVAADAVKLDSAHPTTAYRSARGRFDFDVIGQNFNEDVPEDNKIYVSGQGQIIKEWAADKQHCADSDNLPCLWVESSEKLHVVGYKNESYQGPLTFSVQVGSVRSAEKRLTLSRMSETGVLLFSTAIFLVLAYIIYRLVAGGLRDNVIDGKRYSPFWSFFIDKQTNSYSLSKFQLFSFFSVFVFGYLYVFLCRWLVQWQFVLPDVPSSFSGILAISAGTTLAAAGATAARGSKGSGPVTPSAADFITSGGQVVPERFQFFVWTLVACFGFVALLVSQDPATIEKFPSFPEGLLYVMGVSAGGYLGGKLMRSAGPVIRNIAWDKVKNQIIIQGENLSKTGDFFIDGKKLDIQPSTIESLVEATPQEQSAPDGTFCSQLKITIAAEAGLDLSTGDHDFRIMNKDGQFADARFTADLPAIDSALDPTPVEAPEGADPKKVIAKATAETKIIVKGSGFRAGTTARWKQPSTQDPSELVPEAVNFKDSGELEITLVPGGDPGPGTLTLVTPNGFSATATVTVV